MKNSQNSQILQYLQNGGTLTKIDALNLFNSFSLNSRVSDLRQLGHAIISTPEKTPSGKHIVRYSLDRQPQKEFAFSA